MMKERSFTLRNEAQTHALAKKIAKVIRAPLYISLSGNLGAGKTSFCRGLLQALGYKGAVKSPSYALVEPYEFPQFMLYHFDLYRINDIEELELMGFRDYLNESAIVILEWPEKALNYLPQADLSCTISPIAASPDERAMTIIANTHLGQKILGQL